MPEILPFRIDIPPADLEDLTRRLDHARWPKPVPSGWERGVPAHELSHLLEHWRHSYDWREQEARLNELPQFITEIDGDGVHFVHLRSDNPDAQALVLTHGYPSSFTEFQRVLEPLHHDFHLVVPSLPGYLFSAPPSGTWTMTRTATAWAELMRRLGYDRYGVHGGDIGAGVSTALATLDAAHVTGVHVATDPWTAAATATFMPGMADRLDADDPIDQQILTRMAEFSRDGAGYLAIQNSRPQTIGYGLNDSPLLQLAWIAEKMHEWTDVPVERDHLLNTASLYWFTGTGCTAAHALYDQAHSSDWGAPPAVPQGFAVFGADQTVRRLVNPAPGAHWTEFAHGRHFPALEAPDDLADDLKDFFGRLS